MRYGPFVLAEGATRVRVEQFVRTLRAVDYPWRRILPAVRQDPDQAVVVRWTDTGQGVSGLYFGSRIEIHLSHLDRDADKLTFALAHELGHLVDGTTLDRADRADLLALLHVETRSLGPYGHDHEVMDHPPDRWVHLASDDTEYAVRPNESYADLWVATFAPAIWNGELPGTRQHYPRFVHWTDDLDAVRHLTLRRSITVFTDVPADHPHRENIERAAELGLVGGYPDGTFRPGESLTRAQAATLAVRQYDRIIADATAG